METAFTQDQPEGQEEALVPRDKSRASIFLGAVICFGEERTCRNVRVRNISSGGMMIDIVGPLEKGLSVVAEMKGIGEVRGRIVWSTENRAGVAFNREVNPALARNTPSAAPAAPAYAKPLLDHTRRPGLSSRPGLTTR
jgi:PilZ domain